MEKSTNGLPTWVIPVIVTAAVLFAIVIIILGVIVCNKTKRGKFAVDMPFIRFFQLQQCFLNVRRVGCDKQKFGSFLPPRLV